MADTIKVVYNIDKYPNRSQCEDWAKNAWPDRAVVFIGVIVMNDAEFWAFELDL